MPADCAAWCPRRCCVMPIPLPEAYSILHRTCRHIDAHPAMTGLRFSALHGRGMGRLLRGGGGSALACQVLSALRGVQLVVPSDPALQVLRGQQSVTVLQTAARRDLSQPDQGSLTTSRQRY